MKPKIAIIIPVFNEHQFLAPLLKKIRTITNLPVVVVDDGSYPVLQIPKL